MNLQTDLSKAKDGLRNRLTTLQWMSLFFGNATRDGEYDEYVIDRLYRTMQIAMGLAVLTYAAFGIWDLNIPTGGVESTRFRYMIACPALGLILAATSIRRARARWQTLMMIFGIVAFVCVYVQMVLINRDGVYRISNGWATINYNLSISFIAFFPLRPIRAILLGIFAQAAHAHVLWVSGGITLSIFLAYCFTTWCTFVIIGWISLERERFLRSEFSRHEECSRRDGFTQDAN